MVNIYKAEMIDTDGNKAIKVEAFEAENSGGLIKIVEDCGYKGKKTRLFHFDTIGMANPDFGLGWTPEEAVKSLREGLRREAKEYEMEAKKLRLLAKASVFEG